MKHASPISDWDHLRDNVMAIGSPDTVLKKLQALADSGAGQMIAWMDFGGLEQRKGHALDDSFSERCSSPPPGVCAAGTSRLVEHPLSTDLMYMRQLAR